jgi:type VII secretion protein EccE
MAAATTQGEATASTASAADPRPVRPGQVVAAQVAVALPIAATGHGPLMMAAAVIAGAALIALAWVRMRRRWLFEWAALGVRYRARSHALPAGASAAELLRLVAPDSTVDEAGVVSDRHGLTAILELGDSTLLRDGGTASSAGDARHALGADGRPTPTAADGRHALPAPSSLLPPEGPEHPPTRVQLLLAGSPAPAPRIGGGPPATSYRQLSDGRLPGYERAVIAVRVLRAEGWSEADLRRSLTSASRRISRRLAPLRARRLDGAAVLRVLTELAHHDGSAVRESWGHLVVGGLVQASFRLRRWPDLRAETARRLVPRMLALPAAATTVVIGAGPGRSADLTVRLASDTPAHLAAAAQALRRLVSAEGAAVSRLDGEQLPGTAATLPLGGGTPPLVRRRQVTPPAIEALDLPYGVAGLMIGANRHGAPVVVQLFRAEPTRAVVVGGMTATQLLVFRAMGLGARIVVQTARPQAWEPFVRSASAPGEAIALMPPGRPIGGPPPGPLRPLLVVVDVGTVAADRTPGPGWQATLVVRDDLTPADVDAIGHADLVVLQPLPPEEAALAGAALGLGDAAGWLTRIRDDMVGVVSRRTLRWALLSPTPVERSLF